MGTEAITASPLSETVDVFLNVNSRIPLSAGSNIYSEENPPAVVIPAGSQSLTLLTLRVTETVLTALISVATMSI